MGMRRLVCAGRSGSLPSLHPHSLCLPHPPRCLSFLILAQPIDVQSLSPRFSAYTLANQDLVFSTCSLLQKIDLQLAVWVQCPAVLTGSSIRHGCYCVVSQALIAIATQAAIQDAWWHRRMRTYAATGDLCWGDNASYLNPVPNHGCAETATTARLRKTAQPLETKKQTSDSTQSNRR
jgi:hypothetical protein